MPQTRQKINPNIWLFLAAVNGFLAVAAAAMGDHAVAQRATPEGLALYRLGANFHMFHALALIGVGTLIKLASGKEMRLLEYTGFAFQLGILLFSGSLYWLGIHGPGSLGPFHFVTPLGGISMLVGWAIMSLTAWKVIWHED